MFDYHNCWWWWGVMDATFICQIEANDVAEYLTMHRKAHLHKKNYLILYVISAEVEKL